MVMQFDASHGFLKEDIGSYQNEVSRIHKMIHEKTGAGNDFLGWVDWPVNYDKDEFERIVKLAEKLDGKFDTLVVCGIGGSYLGARAAIEMINGLYPDNGKEVIFAGNTFSSTYMSQVLSHIKDKNVVVNVISKSGTTTETALAFRMLREFMEQKYGKEGAKERIIATTDKARGTLKALADQEGYESFVIPDDIGGRYSVITPVGLVPMALMGIDIRKVMEGLLAAYQELNTDDLEKNPAYRYAVARRILQNQGYNVEMFVTYEPQLSMLSEWWKQLLGESEGKDGKGILPDSATFSTDLHSLGQFIQQGSKVHRCTIRFLADLLDESGQLREHEAIGVPLRVQQRFHSVGGAVRELTAPHQIGKDLLKGLPGFYARVPQASQTGNGKPFALLRLIHDRRKASIERRNGSAVCITQQRSGCPAQGCPLSGRAFIQPLKKPLLCLGH